MFMCTPLLAVIYFKNDITILTNIKLKWNTKNN